MKACDQTARQALQESVHTGEGFHEDILGLFWNFVVAVLSQ
jgi:hypothetical protein